jgi:hypothetical protein
LIKEKLLMLEQSSPLPTLSVDLIRAAKHSEGVLSSLDEESLQRLELQYRKFLLLNGRHPNRSLAPTKILDEMWHLHILHPRAYMKDCMEILGFVLDHDPGFGKEEGEMSLLEETFSITGSLWETEFGEPYTTPIHMSSTMWMQTDPTNPTQCRTKIDEEEPASPDQEPESDQPQEEPTTPSTEPEPEQQP